MSGREPTAHRRGRVRVLVDAYRARGRGVLLGWIFGIGWQAAQVLAPLVIAAAVDRGIVGGDQRALMVWVLVLVGLCLLEVLLTAMRHRFAIIPAVEIGLRLRENLLAGVHRDWHRRSESHSRVRSPGELISRATADVDKVAGLVDFTPSTVACIVSTVAVSVALSVIHPLLALAVVIPLLPVGGLFWWWSRRLDVVSAAQQQATAELTDLAEMSLDQMRAVHGMGALDQVRQRWQEATETARSAGIRLGRRRAALLPIAELFRGAALVLVFLVGSWQLDAGAITVGELFAAVAYAIYLGPLLSQIGAFVAELRTALVAADRLDSATAPKVSRTASPAATPLSLPRAHGSGRHVRIHGLTLAGNELQNLDVTVEPGQVCALILDIDQGPAELGEIFAGRRLPRAGGVEFDGIEICGHELNDVVVVQRSSFLFSGTIGDAVTFGRPTACARDIAAALARSGADDIVKARGVDGVLPVGATTLSGGQRQRIALARALVVDPAVLVCVDALAGLDQQMVAQVGAGLAERGRTTILISTDPAAVHQADKVIDLRPKIRVSP